MTESQRQSMQEAREALIKARDVGVWGTKNLNRNKRRTDALVADLEPIAHEPKGDDRYDQGGKVRVSFYERFSIQ